MYRIERFLKYFVSFKIWHVIQVSRINFKFHWEVMRRSTFFWNMIKIYKSIKLHNFFMVLTVMFYTEIPIFFILHCIKHLKDDSCRKSCIGKCSEWAKLLDTFWNSVTNQAIVVQKCGLDEITSYDRKFRWSKLKH